MYKRVYKTEYIFIVRWIYICRYSWQNWSSCEKYDTENEKLYETAKSMDVLFKALLKAVDELIPVLCETLKKFNKGKTDVWNCFIGGWLNQRNIGNSVL